MSDYSDARTEFRESHEDNVVAAWQAQQEDWEPTDGPYNFETGQEPS